MKGFFEVFVMSGQSKVVRDYYYRAPLLSIAGIVGRTTS